MKKSKIILLFKIFIISLTLYNIFSFYTFNKKFNDKNILIRNEGLITNISYYDDYIILYIKSNVNIKAYFTDTSSDVKIGDKISFSYNEKDITNSGIFNTFNYKHYLKSLGIIKIVDIKSLNKIGENKLYKVKNYFANLSSKKRVDHI